MRNRVLDSLVFLYLVASVQSNPSLSYGKGMYASRNSLADFSSPKSQSVPTYECLYVSPDLPPCDFDRMDDSDEDMTHPSTDDRGGNVADDRPFRLKRNVDESARRHVIVYTIEGCLPPILPYEMRSCLEANSFDKIVDVQRIRPFIVKGLTKPPLVFPEFNFDRWIRMMTRLRKRVASKKNDNKYNVTKKESMQMIGNNDFSHRLSNALMKTPTAITTTNTMSSSTNNKIVHGQQGSAEPVNTMLEKGPSARREESEQKTRSSSSSETNVDHVQATSHTRIRKGMKNTKENKITAYPKKTEHESKPFGNDEQKTDELNKRNINIAMTTISPFLVNKQQTIKIKQSLYRRPTIHDTSNHLRVSSSNSHLNLPPVTSKRYDDRASDKFSYSTRSVFNENNGLADGARGSSYEENLRKKREIRRTVGGSSPRSRKHDGGIVNSASNGLDVSGGSKRYPGDGVFDKLGIPSERRDATWENESPLNTLASLTGKSRSDFPYLTKNFRDKIAATSWSKDAVARKSAKGKIPTRGKHWNYFKLISKFARRPRRQ